jgi:hypothetical protein
VYNRKIVEVPAQISSASVTAYEVAPYGTLFGGRTCCTVDWQEIEVAGKRIGE